MDKNKLVGAGGGIILAALSTILPLSWSICIASWLSFFVLMYWKEEKAYHTMATYLFLTPALILSAYSVLISAISVDISTFVVGAGAWIFFTVISLKNKTFDVIPGPNIDQIKGMVETLSTAGKLSALVYLIKVKAAKYIVIISLIFGILFIDMAIFLISPIDSALQVTLLEFDILGAVYATLSMYLFLTAQYIHTKIMQVKRAAEKGKETKRAAEQKSEEARKKVQEIKDKEMTRENVEDKVRTEVEEKREKAKGEAKERATNKIKDVLWPF